MHSHARMLRKKLVDVTVRFVPRETLPFPTVSLLCSDYLPDLWAAGRTYKKKVEGDATIVAIATSFDYPWPSISQPKSPSAD